MECHLLDNVDFTNKFTKQIAFIKYQQQNVDEKLKNNNFLNTLINYNY